MAREVVDHLTLVVDRIVVGDGADAALVGQRVGHLLLATLVRGDERVGDGRRWRALAVVSSVDHHMAIEAAVHAAGHGQAVSI